MAEKWMKWTVLEAFTKTISKTLQKVVGIVSSTFGQTFYAATLIGMVQFVASLAVIKIQRKSVFSNFYNILGAIAFGLFAMIATFLSFWTFQFEGAEVSVNTFIITLSIVPGSIIDRIFFGHKLSRRQWMGVAIAILAGYVILDCPSLNGMIRMPFWVWLSFGTMISVAINQGITQAIKTIDPMAKNFWGGLTAVVLGVVGMWLFPVNNYPLKLTVVSLLIGVVVIFMWSYNLLSYKGGAYIALKKLVMNGSYLIMVMVVGALFFKETMTATKIIGIFLFFVAFVFLDNATWNFLVSLCKNKEINIMEEEV